MILNRFIFKANGGRRKCVKVCEKNGYQDGSSSLAQKKRKRSSSLHTNQLDERNTGVSTRSKKAKI